MNVSDYHDGGGDADYGSRMDSSSSSSSSSASTATNVLAFTNVEQVPFAIQNTSIARQRLVARTLTGRSFGTLFLQTLSEAREIVSS